ncbi:hypothetical protein HK097_010273 [Rhizophlyctis rosea]|uniref:RRM domain-containing protein n=1 Tax=Rhizophlyctis rosea TaxID=64517 RepID=A0AAD5S9D3_9FUNG|nr:hypothetical protein HK097_010273 [Rhizophlyctis rosea]
MKDSHTKYATSQGSHTAKSRKKDISEIASYNPAPIDLRHDSKCEIDLGSEQAASFPTYEQLKAIFEDRDWKLTVENDVFAVSLALKDTTPSKPEEELKGGDSGKPQMTGGVEGNKKEEEKGQEKREEKREGGNEGIQGPVGKDGEEKEAVEGVAIEGAIGREMAEKEEVGADMGKDKINIRALYVGNLPYSVGGDDLKELFGQAGKVMRADIHTDEQNHPNGSGIVVMSSVEGARKAATMYAGFEWNGRTLMVSEHLNYVETTVTPHQTPKEPEPEEGESTEEESEVENPQQKESYEEEPKEGKSIPKVYANCVSRLRHACLSLEEAEGRRVMLPMRKHRPLFVPMPRCHARSSRNGPSGTPKADLECPVEADNENDFEEINANLLAYALNDPDISWVDIERKLREANLKTHIIAEPRSLPPSKELADNQSRYEVVFVFDKDEYKLKIKSEEDTAKNLEHLGAIIRDGQRIATTCLLIVSQLHPTIQQKDLKVLFGKAGVVRMVDVSVDGKGRSCGYGQVLMATVEEAQKAIQIFNRRKVAGRKLEVREDKSVVWFTVPAPGTQVFIGNLPSTYTVHDLRELLLQHHLLPTFLQVLEDPVTRDGCGWAVARFLSRKDASHAEIDLNGMSLGGEKVIAVGDKWFVEGEDSSKPMRHEHPIPPTSDESIRKCLACGLASWWMLWANVGVEHGLGEVKKVKVPRALLDDLQGLVMHTEENVRKPLALQVRCKVLVYDEQAERTVRRGGEGEAVFFVHRVVEKKRIHVIGHLMVFEDRGTGDKRDMTERVLLITYLPGVCSVRESPLHKNGMGFVGYENGVEISGVLFFPDSDGHSIPPLTRAALAAAAMKTEIHMLLDRKDEQKKKEARKSLCKKYSGIWGSSFGSFATRRACGSVGADGEEGTGTALEGTSSGYGGSMTPPHLVIPEGKFGYVPPGRVDIKAGLLLSMQRARSGKAAEETLGRGLRGKDDWTVKLGSFGQEVGMEGGFWSEKEKRGRVSSRLTAFLKGTDGGKKEDEEYDDL